MENQNKYVKDIADLLKRLGKKYPNQAIATHLSIALSDYNDFGCIGNKELFFILEKYECEKELDIIPQTKSDLDKIIKESQMLDINSLLDCDEEDY